MRDGRPIEWTDIEPKAQRQAIHALMLRRRVRYEEAENAVAEAAFRLISNKVLVTNPHALLVKTAHNILLDTARHDVRRQRISEPELQSLADRVEDSDDGGEGSQYLLPDGVAEERAALRQRVNRAMGKLSAEDQAALSEYYLEGKQLAQAAEAQGVSAGPSRSQLHRARKRLRIVLGVGSHSGKRGR